MMQYQDPACGNWRIIVINSCHHLSDQDHGHSFRMKGQDHAMF
jgi:hypothetical protein